MSAPQRQRRDALAEQQLVRDLWQQVQARIDCSGALRAFLTQKIDDCGQTVAFEAFDLVRQVLNPDGFVRRAHKSADQNLGAAITMPESPWTAEGSVVDRQWDFHGTWHKNRKMWPEMNGYEKLKDSTIQYFCTESDSVEPAGRSEGAEYIKNDEEYDRHRSMPALGADQAVLNILESLPEDEHVSSQHGKPVRRWETFRVNFTDDAVKEVLENGNWTGVPSSSGTSKKKKGLTVTELRRRKSALSKQGVKFTIKDHPPLNKLHKEYWDKILTEAENQNEDSSASEEEEIDSDGSDEADSDEDAMEESEDLSAGAGAVGEEVYNLNDILREPTLLEPYYRLAWRSQDWAKPSNFPFYEYGSKHKMCNQQERPDLILEVGYFSSDSGIFTKRVIICEIDGENKTKPNKKAKSADDDESVPAHKAKDDPIKLALKLMSSTFAQNALQQQTYHIRANYVWCFDSLIDKSLLSTTSLELPEMTDLLRLYGKDTKSPDYTTLHRAIHFIHHMFTAHVKIAFLIYMQVVHNVDMRSMDQTDPRMCNHCFFVNFEASCMPEKLTWQDRMPQDTRSWLESNQMLHTRVQIKTLDYDLQENWVTAPVLDASSDRSALHQWHADVDSARLPRFPYEKQVCVPVVCATIQRVDMKKLTDLVLVAADKANKMYHEAIQLKDRSTKVRLDDKICTVTIKRRQFPDRYFLSRKQQYNRHEWWNDISKDAAGNQKVEKPLRERLITQEDDLLDFTWGYEHPTLNRPTFRDKIDYIDADAMLLKKWDQLDVRMHFFEQAMQEDESWKDAVNGMWYVQDYHDFFDMLRKFPKPAMSGSKLEDRYLTVVEDEFNDTLYTTQKEKDKARNLHLQKSLASSKYAFVLAFHTSISIPFHLNYPVNPDQHLMPVLNPATERAYHMFSILAWFFDCRDAGACRWQWEEHVLNYFGSNLNPGTTESEFDKFQFRRKKESEMTDTKYFDNTWFLMTVFMEVNFRNAVAAMHCRLWEKEAHTLSITGKSSSSLQAMAKELYNRQHSLLNTRARCLGLQGVSAGLSWRKSPARNCLRNLLLSSLDDTLPGLDPQLELYLRQFNAPNAALFLRTIEVSNVLALRELALQHKLASQTSAGASKLEARLAWFEPAVQSEIRHLMHCVERDDSVFTAPPVVHPTKAIVLEEELMRKWVRQTLGVHQHLHSLRCPLDVKFHMFTAPETYRVFMQLFCTKTQLDNSHTQRPVLFVLLQVYLAAEVLRGARQDPVSNTAIDKVQRTNPALQLTDIDLTQQQCHRKHTLNIVDGVMNVPCTPGSSLATWPLRDQNLWCKPERDYGTETKDVKYSDNDLGCDDIQVETIDFDLDPQSCEMQLEYPDEADQITRGMADEELRRWLLLACARPVHCQYEREDDGRYAAGEKKHEFTMQDCAVRQQAEWPHASSTGRQRDTMIAAVSCFEVSAEHRLEVCLCDDADAYIFFEIVEQSEIVPEPFPQYIRDIITPIPDRTRIYVPQVFASHLRKEPIHDKVYIHDDKCWRMVCVGYRAWAWKRLLLKRIFFDALTKVVTRSSVLLSLLQNPVDTDDRNAQKKQNQLYRDMLADTKDTFGALELKADQIKQNIEMKRMQIILTVFRKKKRQVEIDGRVVNLHDTNNSVKVPAAQRQASWCIYYANNLLEETTSRFMLVDNRIHQALLPNTAPHALKDEDVLQYRSYLYITSDHSELSQHSVVSFKGKLYVKFSSKYSMLNSTTGVLTGEVKPDFADSYFATCWDCRRYSCLKPEYVLPPDTGDTIRILAIHAQPASLSKKITVDTTRWPSTPHDDLQACKYICLKRPNGQAYVSKKTSPFIVHAAHSISEQEQNHMHTLPDIFTDNVDPDNMPSMPKVDDWNDVKFKYDLQKIIDDEGNEDAQRKLWNKLRNSSRYIATRHIPNPKDPKNIIVQQVLDTGDPSFKDPFREIIATLRRRILPKTNEDT